MRLNQRIAEEAEKKKQLEDQLKKQTELLSQSNQKYKEEITQLNNNFTKQKVLHLIPVRSNFQLLGKRIGTTSW